MTKMSDARALSALLRSNFPAFTRKVFLTVCPGQELDWSWHLDAVAFQLDQVRL